MDPFGIAISIILCLLGIGINNRKFQSVIVLFFIIYEIVYIARTTSYIGTR